MKPKNLINIYSFFDENSSDILVVKDINLLDDNNYTLAVVDKHCNLIFANRNFIKTYLGTTPFNSADKPNLMELKCNFWCRYTKGSYKNLRIVKLLNSYKKLVGYLYIEKNRIDSANFKLYTQPVNINNIFEKNIYDGLYLADKEANTLKVNYSYEKISLLPESEVKGRNLRELEEKGYFSKSVTLLVLNQIKTNHSTSPISIKQKIITGKEALVTGIPLFNRSKLEYVITIVKEIVPIGNIITELPLERKLWEGFTPGSAVYKNFPIIAVDNKTKKIIETLQKASQSSLPILLKGETGVGKDIMAQYLHFIKSDSKKKNLPFVSINCSSIPKDLLETELFGFEPGSFSGARREGKKGLIELANGGILFLNEIGDLPLDLQAKLLSVLDNGCIRKVGGTKTIEVNFQLISATNRDIEKMIIENKFRKDLYYRISAIIITIPPLRERKNDLLPLIIFFWNKLNSNTKNNSKKSISSSALECLINYDWPGNVRELFNTLSEIFTLSDSSFITIKDLPLKILRKMDDRTFMQNKSLKEIIKGIEIEIIERTISKYGSIAEAAKVLKIDASTIRRKLKATKS